MIFQLKVLFPTRRQRRSVNGGSAGHLLVPAGKAKRHPPWQMSRWETPPAELGRARYAADSPRTPRTGRDVPESVYRELLAQPAHNPNGPLRGVCAFVEVRVGSEDVSETIEGLLTRLGASVRRRLGPSVTHVVFREGRVSTRNQARQRGIPVVSLLWAEECRSQNRLVTPNRFPAIVSAAYDCPILSRQIRKPRSWRTKADTPSPLRRRACRRLLSNGFEAEEGGRAALPPPSRAACSVPATALEHLGSPAERPSRASSHRRSLDDFEPHMVGAARSVATCLPLQPASPLRQATGGLGRCRPSWLAGPSVVLTGLESADREAAVAVVRALGSFSVEAEVGKHTTHVVCGLIEGKPRRTLSVLLALARGHCWLLPVRWAYRSLECGRWLDEAPFAFGRSKPGPSELLSGLGPFYVGRQTAPPAHHIRHLLQLVGAQVSPSYLRCRVCLGDPQVACWLPQVTHASERWLLDCISEQQVRPYDEYLLQRPCDQPLVNCEAP